mgnify:CR=1 FL=1
MAAIGLLAAGVAHEVNTPLTGISSFTQMLLEGADPNDPRTAVLEKIVLPAALFAGFERHDPLPNALYALYQREYGLNIVSAQEELRADAARKDDCRRLKLAPGAPLLHIDRVAISLEGTRVEWRASRCDTSHFVYAVTLS